MGDVKPIPEGFHTLTPALVVQGANEAIEFYQKAFGAALKRIFYGPGSEKTVMHAELEIGNSKLMLSEELPMMHSLSPKSPGGGTSVSLYMYIENVDEVFSKAVSAGATITMPVTDAFWGDRCGSMIDPFGHQWMLATHKKDLTDEEMVEAAKEFFKSTQTQQN